jgi:hypothetical protein
MCKLTQGIRGDKPKTVRVIVSQHDKDDTYYLAPGSRITMGDATIKISAFSHHEETQPREAQA